MIWQIVNTCKTINLVFVEQLIQINWQGALVRNSRLANFAD
jgi:hypothetical protein